VLDVTRNF